MFDMIGTAFWVYVVLDAFRPVLDDIARLIGPWVYPPIGKARLRAVVMNAKMDRWADHEFRRIMRTHARS